MPREAFRGIDVQELSRLVRIVLTVPEELGQHRPAALFVVDDSLYVIPIIVHDQLLVGKV